MAGATPRIRRSSMRSILILATLASDAMALRAQQTIRMCAGPMRSPSASDAEGSFRYWLQAKALDGGALTADLRIITSSATSAEGALRDAWQTIAEVAEGRLGTPSVSVLLLPDCTWLDRWDRFEALTRHLLQCAECEKFVEIMTQIMEYGDSLDADKFCASLPMVGGPI